MALTQLLLILSMDQWLYSTGRLLAGREGLPNTYPLASMINLLREDGVQVEETTMTPDEVNNADEIFNTGNYGKVVPVIKFEERDLQPGPIATRARELYWDYAKKFPI